MRQHPTTRPGRCAAAVVAAVAAAGAASGQVQPVDRGTEDLGPNSVSQRVVETGIGQFSPNGALVDRYGGGPASLAADLYANQQAVGRRYLYRAPGITALYSQSSYLTQDGVGFIGINGTNGGQGRIMPIDTADMVFVLSPELLDQQRRAAEADDPSYADDLGRLVQPTAIGGRLETQVVGATEASEADLLDIAAIHARMRAPQRDPRLVERSRRWVEQREREAREREAQEAGDEAAVAPEDAPQHEPAVDAPDGG